MTVAATVPIGVDAGTIPAGVAVVVAVAPPHQPNISPSHHTPTPAIPNPMMVPIPESLAIWDFFRLARTWSFRTLGVPS